MRLGDAIENGSLTKVMALLLLEICEGGFFFWSVRTVKWIRVLLASERRSLEAVMMIESDRKGR